MAEKTVVSKNLCVELPHSLDDVVAAAMANSVMSSWGALSFRAKLENGQGVLINGATGSSGALAIKVARHFGAKKIVATGRNPVALNALLGEGADEIISLTQDPQALIQNFCQTLETNQISVILDYLWGASAEALIKAIGGDGSHLSSRKIRFVQIGAMSGPVIPLPASVLRSTGLELVGSGIGSIDLSNLILAIGEGLKVAAELGWKIKMASVPLKDAESAWTQDFGGKRLVFTVDGK
jgi:NADPH:quinone reductase-like Zn-dependent oxidoreductase